MQVFILKIKIIENGLYLLKSGKSPALLANIHLTRQYLFDIHSEICLEIHTCQLKQYLLC